jgi:hypothetical protein
MRSFTWLIAGCIALAAASCKSSSSSSMPLLKSKASSDLAQMKGTWERQLRPEEAVPYKRCVKEIGDGHETVTYYDAQGAVQSQHTVDFKLERHGDVRLFTFWNQKMTAGPKAGTQNPQKRSYIYRLVGNELAEVWGFLPGQEERPISYHVHKRIKAAGPATWPAAK